LPLQIELFHFDDEEKSNQFITYEYLFELKNISYYKHYIQYAILAFIDENQDFLFQFTGEHPGLINSPAGDRLRSRYIKHITLLSTPIHQAVKNGDIRRDLKGFLPIHYGFLARTFMIEKMLMGTKEPLAKKTGQFMDLFLKGAAAR